MQYAENRVLDGLNRIAVVLALALFALLAWQGLQQEPRRPEMLEPSLLERVSASGGDQLFRPIPRRLDLDPRKLALGELLFHDPRLSGNGFSCNSCHPVESGGMDGLSRSMSLDGGRDVMNTPTIFNVGFYPYLQWRADQPDLAAQIDAVLVNPLHMGSSWMAVEEALAADAGYLEAFETLYGSKPRAEYIRDALVTFEQSLITPDSDFDRWLLGDSEAMTEQQLEGYRLFREYGCASCHQGINLGGNLVARYGVFGSAYHHREHPLNDFDQGRFLITGRSEDRFMFRVPGLRNVAVTAPYFHDGSIPTLDAAIEHMGRVQLGIAIPSEDRVAIAAFLGALTGEYRGRRL